VKLDADQAVSATFGPPKGTAITKAAVQSKKKTATFAFSAPGAITGFQCMLIKPKPKPRKRHRAHKRPKPRFSSCSAPATFKHLAPGRYRFAVRALDILGPDATPASRSFRVKGHKAKKHRRHPKVAA
jgi:hypothetical protein